MGEEMDLQNYFGDDGYDANQMEPSMDMMLEDTGDALFASYGSAGGWKDDFFDDGAYDDGQGGADYGDMGGGYVDDDVMGDSADVGVEPGAQHAEELQHPLPVAASVPQEYGQAMDGASATQGAPLVIRQETSATPSTLTPKRKRASPNTPRTRARVEQSAAEPALEPPPPSKRDADTATPAAQEAQVLASSTPLSTGAADADNGGGGKAGEERMGIGEIPASVLSDFTAEDAHSTGDQYAKALRTPERVLPLPERKTPTILVANAELSASAVRARLAESVSVPAEQCEVERPLREFLFGVLADEKREQALRHDPDRLRYALYGRQSAIVESFVNGGSEKAKAVLPKATAAPYRPRAFA